MTLYGMGWGGSCLPTAVAFKGKIGLPWGESSPADTCTQASLAPPWSPAPGLPVELTVSLIMRANP
jgi:hypothetical protein